MKKKIKQIACYHAIHVVYLDNSHLTGHELGEIWSSMQIFGDHPAVGGFWRETEPETITGKEQRLELGSVECLTPFLERNNTPIFGGGVVCNKVSKNTIHNHDIYFTYSCSSRWYGLDTRPDLNIAIADHYLDSIGIDKYIELVYRHFEIIDRHAPSYGLVDLDTPQNACAGLVYSSMGIMQAPLHRWVEQRNWVAGGSKKGDQARGVYWGNYFGKAILDKLGGKESFIRAFLEMTRLRDGSSSAILWEFANGVFVSLCLDPRGCAPGKPLDMAARFNLEWLHTELGTKGVLSPWN